MAPEQPPGHEPDYRFTLANERTFLAWTRTSLALMAAGVAVVRFVPGLGVARHLLGVLLVGLGGVLAATSYRQWGRNERAIRDDRPLPTSVLPRLVSVVLVVGAVVAVALVLADLAGA